MTDETQQDAAFTARALDALPPAAPSPGFSGALMAAYDTWQAERRSDPWTALGAGARRFSEAIWPGAPVWAPGSLLAAALVAGLCIGVVLPSPMGSAGYFVDESSLGVSGADMGEGL